MFKPLSEFVSMTLTYNFGLPFFISFYYLSSREHFPQYWGISVFDIYTRKVRIIRRVTLTLLCCAVVSEGMEHAQ